MKKVSVLLLAVLAAGSVQAKVLRVNNNVGVGAPYTSAAEAITAAETGDVVLLEKSLTSYGDFTVDKSITIQGEGYFLGINGMTEEGAVTSEAGTITLDAPNVKVTNLSANKINFKPATAHSCVVTRCYVTQIILAESFSYQDDYVDGCIIHQNFIAGNISCDQYSEPAKNIQITNNIFLNNYTWKITYITHSVITHNTFAGNTSPFYSVKNSVIEYNIFGSVSTESTNSYKGNVILGDFLSLGNDDKTAMEAELSMGVDAGAFSGDDPYVLSGVPAGPHIVDLTVPASVEQGQDLQVTVKIATSK